MTIQAAKTRDDKINGFDVPALFEIIEEIKKDPSKGMAKFRVTSGWEGRTRSKHQVEGYSLGGRQIPRPHTLTADEPVELLGENTAPNPQELLLAAMNSCILVGYVAGASVNGIALESVEIETEGELDLRGFLGIDDGVRPGYDSIRYTVRIKGDGSPEQFQEIHEMVKKTSPNYFNISRPIRLDAELVVE